MLNPNTRQCVSNRGNIDVVIKKTEMSMFTYSGQDLLGIQGLMLCGTSLEQNNSDVKVFSMYFVS